MSRRRGRNRPSSPQEIAARRAEARADAAAEDRRVSRTPGEWGISADIVALPSSCDVDVIAGNRGRLIHAKRSDPFDLLHSGGGLSDHQHMAARRLFRDWCLRAGVRDHERRVMEKVDETARIGLVNDAMIDAAKRIEAALSSIGIENSRILRALIAPMVDSGAVIVWRGTVQRITGETERHAQGSVVRRACENLRLHYRIGPIEADFDEAAA